MHEIQLLIFSMLLFSIYSDVHYFGLNIKIHDSLVLGELRYTLMDES